jgi:threonine aldolase
VRRLEEETAALLGKEAALFVPSGTMSNQLALLLHTRRGDEVIVGQGAHMEGGRERRRGGVERRADELRGAGRLLRSRRRGGRA